MPRPSQRLGEIDGIIRRVRVYGGTTIHVIRVTRSAHHGPWFTNESSSRGRTYLRYFRMTMAFRSPLCESRLHPVHYSPNSIALYLSTVKDNWHSLCRRDRQISRAFRLSFIKLCRVVSHVDSIARPRVNFRGLSRQRVSGLIEDHSKIQ